MENILQTICRNKRTEVVRQQEAVSIAFLEQTPGFRKRATVSFRQALASSKSGIIAEFKRRSPSKGWLHPEADATEIITGYEASGAAAISCLTDEKFFGGGFEDFRKARAAIKNIPLLRKDFIIDEYQIFQSRAMGADVILLIAACLLPEETRRFSETAHELGMETLLEIHDEQEISHICPTIDVIGVNNRNLKTFATDISHTIALANKIPDSFLKISESGLSDPKTIIDLRNQGFRGFLMGETFMKTAEPGKTLAKFISELACKQINE
jgi:indole-3-glycerol phosphate synthase